MRRAGAHRVRQFSRVRQERQEALGEISVMRFTVFGAVGFGIGGTIAGGFGDAMLLGYFVMGALGGASLKLADGDKRSIATLTLTSALGFGIGFLIAFAIVLLGWDPFGNWFIGAVGGGLGGASLGVGLRTWSRVVPLVEGKTVSRRQRRRVRVPTRRWCP